MLDNITAGRLALLPECRQSRPNVVSPAYRLFFTSVSVIVSITDQRRIIPFPHN
jgi:hypothetical protein